MYFYSADEQKYIIYVRKRIPSSLMKNVEIVSEYFYVEVKECRKIPQNVAKFHSTSWKCAVSPFSHKMALNNFLWIIIYTNFKRDQILTFLLLPISIVQK
jgi:hypothetical protein